MATVDPWAGDLPSGPELRALRKLCGVGQELAAAEGGVGVLTVWRFETGRTTAPTAMESPQFRRLVTALYELAAERKALAERHEALRRAALA